MPNLIQNDGIAKSFKTDSSNSLRFLRVGMETMNIVVICAVVKEEFRMFLKRVEQFQIRSSPKKEERLVRT